MKKAFSGAFIPKKLIHSPAYSLGRDGMMRRSLSGEESVPFLAVIRVKLHLGSRARKGQRRSLMEFVCLKVWNPLQRGLPKVFITVIVCPAPPRTRTRKMSLELQWSRARTRLSFLSLCGSRWWGGEPGFSLSIGGWLKFWLSTHQLSDREQITEPPRASVSSFVKRE